MYDPRRPRSAGTSLEDEWLPVVDAFDLTDVASMYDQPLSIYHADDEYDDEQYYYYDDMAVESFESSGDSHAYMDLTRFATYTTEDHPTTMTTSAEEDPTYQTPPPPTPRNYQEDFFPILASPTPPTPIPEFRVFDLTCFIEDSVPARSPVVRVDPISPNRNVSSPREPPILYKVAPPSQDYHDAVANSMESCHDYYASPTTTRSEHPRHHAVFSEEEEEEEEEQPEEHSTIHLTDFSRSSGPAPSTDLYQFSSYSLATTRHAGASADENPLAIDCNLPGIFDRMCRRKPLADTNDNHSLAAKTTKSSILPPKQKQRQQQQQQYNDEIRSCGTLPQDEIRSCGTLPPDVPPEKQPKTTTAPTKRRHRQTAVHQQNKSSRNKVTHKQLGSDKKSCSSRNSGTTRSMVGMASTMSEDYDSDEDERPRMYDSNESQTDAGCEPPAKAEPDAYKAPSSCSTGTVTTEESFDHNAMDRRYWMGTYVSGLFDWNVAKDIFHATYMEEKQRQRVPSTQAEKDLMKKKGGMQGDFSVISDFCRRVVQHLDMAEVVANIDQGVYDDHLDDFQEDIELCFEDAIEQYEKSLEKKNQKQKQKQNKDTAASAHAQQERHKNLRLLASEELMKQLETDFKMQLLDHFCLQVSKKQRKISTMRSTNG